MYSFTTKKYHIQNMHYTLISMLSISLTFSNHAATQNTTGVLISSTTSKLNWSTICSKTDIRVQEYQTISIYFYLIITAYLLFFFYGFFFFTNRIMHVHGPGCSLMSYLSIINSSTCFFYGLDNQSSQFLATNLTILRCRFSP